MIKMLKFKNERTGNGLLLTASWRTEMKQPAKVKINILRGEFAEDADDVVMQGDVTDVNGILFGLADAAWDAGWRPRGLFPALLRVMETHKLAPDAKR